MTDVTKDFYYHKIFVLESPFVIGVTLRLIYVQIYMKKSE